MFSNNSCRLSQQGPRYQTIPTNEVDLNVVENNSLNKMNNNHDKVNKWKYLLLLSFSISVVLLMLIFNQGGSFALNGIFGSKTSILAEIIYHHYYI
jgi:hypothetical protein